MNSRYVLLPYVSYIMNDKEEEIEVTSVKISRNEEKQRFEIAILAHKEILKEFGVKDMTIQVQQYEHEDGLHKFVIAAKNKTKAEIFIKCELEKEDIEKIIQSMII